MCFYLVNSLQEKTTGLDMRSVGYSLMSTIATLIKYVELWYFRCYSLCRGVLVTFGHMLNTKTVLRFSELVTKIHTKLSTGADDRVELSTEWNSTFVEEKTISQGTSCSKRTTERERENRACPPDFF